MTFLYFCDYEGRFLILNVLSMAMSLRTISGGIWTVVLPFEPIARNVFLTSAKFVLNDFFQAWTRFSRRASRFCSRCSCCGIPFTCRGHFVETQEGINMVTSITIFIWLFPWTWRIFCWNWLTLMTSPLSLSSQPPSSKELNRWSRSFWLSSTTLESAFAASSADSKEAILAIKSWTRHW